MKVNKKTQSLHWASKDLKIIESYWTSPPASLRSKWFAKQLECYNFFSIYEVGFFAGRNLRYILERFPSVDIAGLEINKNAVKFARKKLPNAELHHMNLHDFNQFKKYDIIFTSGTLIHVPPDDIPEVLPKFITGAKKYLMHIETLGNNELSAGPKKLKPSYKVSDQWQWAPNLVKMYKDLGLEPEVVSLPEEVRTNGASELLIVKL